MENPMAEAYLVDSSYTVCKKILEVTVILQEQTFIRTLLLPKSDEPLRQIKSTCDTDFTPLRQEKGTQFWKKVVMNPTTFVLINNRVSDQKETAQLLRTKKKRKENRKSKMGIEHIMMKQKEKSDSQMAQQSRKCHCSLLISV